MKKTAKRVFSLFLCLILCMTLLPAAAFAEDEIVGEDPAPAVQSESSVVLSVEDVAAAAEEADVPAETEALVEETEESLFQLSGEQRSAILSRDDGLWLFPLDEEYYGNITDWNGCRGAEPCLFCGESHESCPDSEHSGLQYGHWGLDISVPEGTAVYAPSDGTVWWTDRDWEGLGYTLVLERPAENGWSYYAVFSHLSDVCLESGSQVAAGELIARTGSSGAEDEPEHLAFSLFMAQSDLGQRVAADPVAELAAIADKGWLEEGSGEGMVNNNPAADSPARPLPEDSTILPQMEKHPGTVRYTFDPAELSADQPAELPQEETVSHEEPAQTNAAVEEPDADTTSTTVTSGTCGDNLTWTLDNTGTLIISGTGNMYDYKSSPYAPWCSLDTKVERVIIEDGVSSIGVSAFTDCSDLINIVIPDSVSKIGNSAFYGCVSLTGVVIPEGITEINEYVFYDCVNLDSITIPNGVVSIKRGSFDGCTSLSSIVIPAGVKSVGIQAFSNCISLTSVTIPDSVTSIGNCAFSSCSSLTSVTIPDSVTSIGNCAFSSCSSLTSVTIPDSVTSLGEKTFYGCSNLSNVTIPASITNIGTDAFLDCGKLTGVYISDLKSWCNISFSDPDANPLQYAKKLYLNSELVTDIVISEDVGFVGDFVFYNCESLINVKILEGVTSIGNYSFWYCCNIENFELPNNMTNIGRHAFHGCSNITSIMFPEGVTCISPGTFSQCSSMTSIVIPDGVTTIGDYAFSYCSSLTRITIPSSVKSIRESGFFYCTGLTGVYISDLAAWCNIDFVDDYTGAGISSNPLSYAKKLYLNNNLITDLMIPESANNISDYAFYDCDSLTSVTISKNVSSIGVQAFYNCDAVVKIEILDGMTSIGDSAFGYCKNLSNILLPDTLNSIGNSAFYVCNSLTTVSIPSSVTSIGDYTFSNCSSLSSVSIPVSVTTIDNYAFNSCSSLTDVYYGGGEAQWNAISIGSDNEPLLNATIHYFSNIGNTGAITLDKLSVICYANQKDSEKTSEDFILCPEVSLTSGQLQEITDEKGQATLDKPDTDVTFTKAGYVSRTISLARLSHNNVVYLQKESDYPVISALWLGDTDILHEEITLEYASEESFDLCPEVSWGKSSIKTLQLCQDSNTLALQEGTNSVQLAKSFDITKTIYLVATNADGLTAKKELKLKSSGSGVLDGFSFNLGDSLSFTLPDSAGILAGTKFDIVLYSPVPVEVVNEDGKIYVAIGYQWDGSQDKSREVEVKSFAESAKSLTELSKTIKDEKKLIKACRDEMKKYGKGLKTMKGSFGVDGNFSILAFAEGYLDSSGNFVLTDSGGILSFGASASYTKPFLAGPVPMFFEVKLSGDVEAQINLYINQEIKAFTPRMAIEGIVALQGGVGVGAAKVASLSGGLKGKLTQNLNLDNGIDYYKLSASLEWYVKLKILFASWKAGKEITSAVWYEYPEPGTASAQALQESSGGKPDFYDSSRYTMDDLSYLERGSGFMGGGASVLSVDGSSGDGPFVSNAYEGASPQAVSFSDGTRLAVWIGYNDLHSGPDALNLYYSYYDGAWSQPQVVEDDGTTDAAPCLRVFDDTAYLVWQDASGSIPESATLDSTANLMEISGGVFDRESVSFTCAGITGGSGVLNMTPTLCGDGSTVCAVWLRNCANDWFGQNFDNSILTSSFSEGSWSSPATLYSGLGPVVSMAADCTGGSVSVACSIDGDCDLNTSEDMEVYLNGKALTENEYIDNGVCFSGGNLYWYSGGRLLENGNDTMAEGAAIGSDRFQIINENGIKALVYAAEDGLASVLYAAYYDSASGGWGSPIVLYSAGTSISAFSASATADGEISVLLQSQAITGDFSSEDPYGEVSLVWYNAPMGCNIRLNDIRIDNSAYVAGKDVPLYLSVSNTGELAVQSLLIEVLDTDGTLLQQETIAQQLLSGETAELMTVYSVKEVIQGKALTVRVSAVGAEETLTDDNSAGIVLGWNDLTVESVRYGVTESGETVIHASIANRGYELQSDVVVELREGSPSGTLVEAKTVSEISAFSLENVSFTLSGTPAVLYYVCVEHRESDCNFGNDNSFVEIKAQSGEETATPGDLNGDGQVNTMDLIRLMKYISGVEVDVAPGTADVNGDGKENTMDLIRLMKLVNGEIV